MKKINVIVKDRNTIVLEEDAQKGDYIDLSSLSNVDFSCIEDAINDGKDEVYKKKLEEYKASLETVKNSEQKVIEEKYKSEVNELKSIIDNLRKENDYNLRNQESELLRKFEQEKNLLNKKIDSFESDKVVDIEKIKSGLNVEIERLKNENKALRDSRNTDIENEKLKLEAKFTAENNDLKNKLESQRREFDVVLKDKELDTTNRLNELKETYNKELLVKDNIIREKEEAYNRLQFQKSIVNVKQTGEDLESWCDNEVTSYMQNGLFNCRWIKDNKVIKDENEHKGSKADYILKVYSDSNRRENELLTSICFDMKDENPSSTNKKKNSDYYKDLDKNRGKKECKYAVLVSNLELDRPNDLPIFKVNEYEDMYVVRPGYMMTFINMVVSLSTRFAELVLKDEEYKLELKSSMELMEEFNALKTTYLDKPLGTLAKNINEIKSSSSSILTAAKKIDETCESIIKNFINIIENKLSTFEIKLNKAYKKAS